jgi:two-component system response regulator PilR (NtrC family)
MIAMDERKELIEKIRWLLLLRVVTLSFFLGASALFHFFQLERDVIYLVSLSVSLILAYLISVGSALFLPRVKNLRRFAHAQVSFDVLLITGIIWLTGDIASPFSFLYNLAVLNAAILLFYRGAFLTAASSSVCYTALLLWSRYWDHAGMGMPLYWSPLVTVLLNIGSYFVIAWLGGFLADKLGEIEKLLKEKQIDYLELDAFKDALLEGIGSGVAITNDKGQINFFNRQAQTLTGLEETNAMGKCLDQLFPGLNYDLQRNRSAGTIITEEFPFESPQGARRQLRVTLAPLSNAKEVFVGFVAILSDITQQKQIEEQVRLEEEMRRARQEALSESAAVIERGDFHFEGIIGKSGGIAKIYQLIQKVATSNTNVLISGESGTGKELVARSIHLNGPRKDKPFVAVNCGAIPETLIESELFGHMRGAFTGAVSDHTGLFKRADQGTVFLDEVGELPLHLQVKLLRVLQDKTFTPVGGTKQIKVDVRVISATNRDLRRELEEGRFREDLFYRLNVVHMVLPPLRSRKEDIPGLAHYFLRKFADAQSKNVEEISSSALMHLMNYAFPGNVRELENILEHAVAVANENVLSEEDLPQHVRGAPLADEAELFERTAPGGAELFFSKGLSLDVELETHEKCILLGALKRANGVQKKAAEILGINYRSLRHRLEKYDMLNSKVAAGNEQSSDRQ